MSVGHGILDVVPHIRPWEVVESALTASDAGVPDALNAAHHGVAVKTIRRWRRDYQRRGKARGQAHTTVRCPQCEDGVLDESAFSELFGWYLGDGHISAQRRGVYGLHVYNDLIYVNANASIAALMGRVNVGGRPHTRQVPGCLVTTMSWKHWPCLFPQHGPGHKHERALTMQDWQWDAVVAHPASFLRGLFHSDGCLTRNRVRRKVGGEVREYVYPRWQFCNASEEILGWCGDALDLVDVAWRRSAPRILSVSRRDDVARLTALIGEKG